MKFLREVLILIIGAILGIGGTYFTSIQNQQIEKDQNIFNLTQHLYDEHHKKISTTTKALQKLFSAYDEGFGVSPFEIKEETAAFRDALQSYDDYANELERYGNDEQLHTVKQEQNILWRAYQEFFLMNEMAQNVHGRLENLLQIENTKSEMFSLYRDSLEDDLHRMICNENRAHSTLKFYIIPTVYNLEQYVNYSFRRSLKLGQTSSIMTALDKTDDLISQLNEYKYEEKEYPFHFAKNRTMAGPHYKLEAPEGAYTIHELKAKEFVKNKFLTLTVENNDELKSILLARGWLNENNSTKSNGTGIE